MRMNKVIFFVLCLCSAISSKGQLCYGGEIAEGLSGFMPSGITSGIKNEFKLGAFLRYPIKQNLFIESGVYCGRACTDIEHFFRENEVFQKMEAGWTYFDIPLLLGRSFRLSKKGKTSLSVYTGLYAMWGVNGEATLTLKDKYRENVEVKIDNLFEKKQIELNSALYTLESQKRLNAGGRLGVDCIYKKWTLKLTASISFMQYTSNFVEGVRPYSVLLGVGYYLRE